MPLEPKLTKYTTQSPINAVFNWDDFDSGVSYVTYLCYNAATSSGKTYHMNKNQIHSNDIETTDTTSGVGTSPAYAKSLDIDFDTSPFDVARTINGDVLINLTLGFLFNSANGVNFYGIAKLYKVDSSGETLLGTATSETDSQVSNNAWKSKNFTLPMTISNQLIPRGSWLRLTVEHWGSTGSSASSVDTIIGHSPYNLDGLIVTSTQDSEYNQTILNIPYKRE